VAVTEQNDAPECYRDVYDIAASTRPLAQRNPGIYRLMLVMFEDALHCLHSANNTVTCKPRHRFPEARQARKWILTRNEDWYLFSFERVCYELGLNAEAVREQLWKQDLLTWEKGKPDLVVLTAKGRFRRYNRMRWTEHINQHHVAVG
jgi:hypothetical protein